LAAAFVGVQKLLLVSAPSFSDAVTGHHNVITAAADAGVSHLHFTAIQRRTGSGFVIPQVTEWERRAEEELADSGMAVTILRNTLYLDSLDDLVGEPDGDGVIRVPAGHTPASVATRRDLAEATARILAENGHAGQTYTLSGSHPITLDDIAVSIGKALNRDVTYRDVPPDTWVADAVRRGLPEPTARFLVAWFGAIAAGEFSETGDLARFLGRSPTDPLEFVYRRRLATPASRD
jgi:NAD(P)H dehydrogenase (quinone)